MEFATAFAIIIGLIWFIFFMRSERRAEKEQHERDLRSAAFNAAQDMREKMIKEETARRRREMGLPEKREE